jgi:hypothetical protein
MLSQANAKVSYLNYGKYADAEARRWLGLKSWNECWSTMPLVVRRSWFQRKIPDQD